MITEKPIRGWGEDPTKVEAVIKDDAECLAMFREAMTPPNHRPAKAESNNNVISFACLPQGNSKAYTCERLSKVAPELFEEVKAGRMSAHAAAIQAGIRKKLTPEEECLKAFLRSENKLQVLGTLVNRLTNEQQCYFIESIGRSDTRDLR